MVLTRATVLSLDSIEQFRKSCIGKGHSTNTAKAYSTDLRMMLTHFQVTEISQTEYEEAASNWLTTTRQEASPKTTGRRLTSARAFARWARWQTELDEYRAPTARKTLPHPIPEGLAGLERLLEVAWNDDLRAIVGACGFAGMRIGEALAFKTTWLDPTSRTIRVRGKGDKERTVPMSNRAWDAIAPAFVKAMNSESKLLINYQDRSARYAVSAMGRHAGLMRSISSHDLRATCATILNDNNVNIRVIQEFLGHGSVTTTEIYTGITMSAMREAVDF